MSVNKRVSQSETLSSFVYSKQIVVTRMAQSCHARGVGSQSLKRVRNHTVRAISARPASRPLCVVRRETGNHRLFRGLWLLHTVLHAARYAIPYNNGIHIYNYNIMMIDWHSLNWYLVIHLICKTDILDLSYNIIYAIKLI